MLRLATLFLVCVSAAVAQQALYVGGFFPSKGWPVGDQVSPAMDIAFQDINARTDILPNHQLISRIMDSECNPAVANAKFNEDQGMTQPSVAVVGGGCDVVSLALGIQNGPAALGYQNSVPVVSWGSTSDLLSDKQTYPYFSRVLGPNKNQARAIVATLKEYKWERVGLLSQPGEPHNSLRFAIKEEAARQNVRIVLDDVFANADDSVAALPASIERAKKNDVRIFILVADADVAAVILRGYGDAGLASTGNQWIGSSSWAAQDLTATAVSPNLDFSQRALLAAYQAGAFGVTVARSGVGTSDAKYVVLRDKVNLALGRPGETDLFPYTGYVYDAAYAVALALHEVLEVQQVATADATFSAALQAAIKAVVFDGVTGTVAFDVNGDRPTGYAVFNNRPQEVVPFSASVATVSEAGEFSLTGETVIFGGNVLAAPVDGGDDNEDGEPGSPYWIGITVMLIVVPILLTSFCGCSTYAMYRNENFQQFD